MLEGGYVTAFQVGAHAGDGRGMPFRPAANIRGLRPV
jgi:hypothetical protein